MVCEANHVLARLVQTVEGPVITGKTTPVTITFDDSPGSGRTRGRRASAEVAVLLNLLTDNQAVGLACRCGHADIRASMFRACLADERRSAVYAVR